MIRRTASPHRVLALSVVAALGLGGCAKKVTQVDSAYNPPEGVTSPQARLMVKPDIPIEYIEYFDRLNVGAPVPVDTLFYTTHDTLSSGHVRLATYTIYESGPGAVGALIADSTVASNYQMLRRESSGGFRISTDFIINPTRRWLDTQWEAYTYDDPNPASFQPPTYLGRGLLANEVKASSPLTNAGVLGASFVDTLRFDYGGLIDLNDLPDSTFAPPDSIFGLHWAQVPGAVGYWIQIFQFYGTAHEQVLSSLPSPMYLGKSRDFFVGFVPAPADSYRLGTPGATVLTRRTILNHQDYFARISAVNADGLLLAHSYGRPTRVPGPQRNTWDVFWRGGILIRPGPQIGPAPSP